MTQYDATVSLAKIVNFVDEEGHPVNPPERTREITGLKDNIAEIGLLSPLLVLPANDAGEYGLLAGYRRRAALRSLGWTEAPVTFYEGTRPLLVLASSNVQERFTPMQEARLCSHMRAAQHTEHEIASAFGFKRKDAKLRFLLLRASEHVQERVEDGRMSWSAFERIAHKSVDEQDVILEIAKRRARSERLTVRTITNAKHDREKEQGTARIVGDPQALARRCRTAIDALNALRQETPYSESERRVLAFWIMRTEQSIEDLKEAIS